MYLITKWFGIFLCNNNEIKSKILFPKNANEIIKKLEDIKNNKILFEEKKIAKGIKVIVNEKRLSTIGNFVFSDPFFNSIVINFEDFGFSFDLFKDVTLFFAQKRVDYLLQSEDLQIIQMVNSLDDLIQTANLLSERLNCWSVISTPDEKIKPFKELLSNVNDEINRLENQIDLDMVNIAPNTSKVVGCLIGARLISLAGGLNKLALMPSSTIQVLGAEKALFRLKKEGGKPPKHGIIFQHLSINSASKKQRGRIARLLSSAISTAVKADAFTKRYIADDLLADLKLKIDYIKNK